MTLKEKVATELAVLRKEHRRKLRRSKVRNTVTNAHLLGRILGLEQTLRWIEVEEMEHADTDRLDR